MSPETIDKPTIDKPTIDDPKQFEESLQALEAIVDQLERGDLGLEASLAAFEQGIRLSRGCQRALDQAEQRIRILSEPSEAAEPEPLTDDTADSARD
ncbi:MAG: exodeoxyribonuclease VII small subunit [Halochromatium sp.]